MINYHAFRLITGQFYLRQHDLGQIRLIRKGEVADIKDRDGVFFKNSSGPGEGQHQYIN